ncbi:MAG: hypothetical protein WEA04_02655 [Candidatus Andersenbacteria bacterium]
MADFNTSPPAPSLPPPVFSDQPQQPQAGGGSFKPNIYPIMYWALAFGVAAGVILFLVYLLSRFLTYVWAPVFLAGVIWGGFRNYKRQKQAWATSAGMAPMAQSPWEEFKQALQDIVAASRDLMQQETAPEATEEAVVQAVSPVDQTEGAATTDESLPEENPDQYRS